MRILLHWTFLKVSIANSSSFQLNTSMLPQDIRESLVQLTQQLSALQNGCPQWCKFFVFPIPRCFGYSACRIKVQHEPESKLILIFNWALYHCVLTTKLGAWHLTVCSIAGLMHCSIWRFCVSLLIFWCLRNVIVSVSIRISTSFVVVRLLFELSRVPKVMGSHLQMWCWITSVGEMRIAAEFIWGCTTQISRSSLEISILNVVGCGKWTHGKLTLGCANTSGESGC